MNAFSLLQSLSMPLLPPDDENLVRFLTKIPGNFGSRIHISITNIISDEFKLYDLCS